MKMEAAGFPGILVDITVSQSTNLEGSDFYCIQT
jgi:hypothetical protein